MAFLFRGFFMLFIWRMLLWRRADMKPRPGAIPIRCFLDAFRFGAAKTDVCALAGSVVKTVVGHAAALFIVKADALGSRCRWLLVYLYSLCYAYALHSCLHAPPPTILAQGRARGAKRVFAAPGSAGMVPTMFGTFPPAGRLFPGDYSGAVLTTACVRCDVVSEQYRRRWDMRTFRWRALREFPLRRLLRERS